MQKLNDSVSPKPKLEFKCLKMIKKDIENLYKEFVAIAFSFHKEGEGDKQSLLKFERKLNNAIENVNEMHDYLEEKVRKENLNKK